MLTLLLVLTLTTDRVFHSFGVSPFQRVKTPDTRESQLDIEIPLNLPAETIRQLQHGDDESAIITLAQWITADLENDYDKLEAIYDWVTANFAYDLEKANNLSAYGAGATYLLETGRGVCHDYAELTRELLTAVGIEATYESGRVRINETETELHAWNQALVNNRWYALDTTWGAGFIIEDTSEFIQSPRRIYLTTPEELLKLHNDLAYKQEKEKEYWHEEILATTPTSLPALEYNLSLSFNEYRRSKRLSELTEEHRLNAQARSSAVQISETLFLGDDYPMADIMKSFQEKVPDLNIASASLVPFIKIVDGKETKEDLIREIIRAQIVILEQEQWDAVSIGAINRGELYVIIIVYITYH